MRTASCLESRCREYVPFFLALLLSVPRVLLADDADDPLTADDLALCATDLDGCPDFHVRVVSLFVAVDNASPRKVVGGQF